METQQDTGAAPAKGRTMLWVIALAAIIVGAVLLFGTGGKTPEVVQFTATSTGYSSDVPANAVPTAPVSTTTVTNKDSKEPLPMKFFDVRAEGGKFTPTEIVVQKGDQVIFNFTAVDAKYDFFFKNPSIGLYVIAEKGETKTFGFNSASKDAGTYDFGCEKFCGVSGAYDLGLAKLVLTGK